MQLTDIISRAGGLQAMARELGVDESQAATQATPQGGGLDTLLEGLLVGGQAIGTGGVSGALGGLGGLASMLDLNRDGNPLDDILQMLGKGMR